MYYYYGGKEKKAGQVKKETEEAIVPYQRDFDMMMERFHMNLTISGLCRRGGGSGCAADLAFQ